MLLFSQVFQMTINFLTFDAIVSLLLFTLNINTGWFIYLEKYQKKKKFWFPTMFIAGPRSFFKVLVSRLELGNS